jgi:hypothetical protein
VKPSKEQLDFCIAQLSRFIPSPPRPTTKARKSKWGAKVGENYTRNDKLWTVTGTDSLGVTLESSDGFSARIEDSEGFTTFARVRKARKRRATPAEPAPLLSGGV